MEGSYLATAKFDTPPSPPNITKLHHKKPTLKNLSHSLVSLASDPLPP
jgi:hypothetical protein